MWGTLQQPCAAACLSDCGLTLKCGACLRSRLETASKGAVRLDVLPVLLNCSSRRRNRVKWDNPAERGYRPACFPMLRTTPLCEQSLLLASARTAPVVAPMQCKSPRASAGFSRLAAPRG